MASILPRIRTLRRDKSGASVLELGLALPIMMTVLLGLVDVASCYSAQMSIQQAAARALERVQVGTGQPNVTLIDAEAEAAAGSGAQATVTTWLECNEVQQGASVQDCPAGQRRARYVRVAITSSYWPYFPYTPLGTRNSNGSVPLAAASSVRYQ